MDEETIKKVIAQYEAIRRSGEVNMFDKYGVQHIASDNNLHELVIAIEDGGYIEILKNYSGWIKLITEDDIPDIGCMDVEE